jgi:hypothetical protein
MKLRWKHCKNCRVFTSVKARGPCTHGPLAIAMKKEGKKIGEKSKQNFIFVVW